MPDEVTFDAQQVITLAQDEARRLNHNYIGTEHLVLGLMRQDGVAATTLLSLGASLDAAREQVRGMIGQGQLASPEVIPFTPRAGQTLALALRAARERGHDRADTGHLLLGLTQLKAASEGQTLLARMGITIGEVQRAISQELDRG